MSRRESVSNITLLARQMTPLSDFPFPDADTPTFDCMSCCIAYYNIIRPPASRSVIALPPIVATDSLESFEHHDRVSTDNLVYHH